MSTTSETFKAEEMFKFEEISHCEYGPVQDLSTPCLKCGKRLSLVARMAESVHGRQKCSADVPSTSVARLRFKTPGGIMFLSSGFMDPERLLEQTKEEHPDWEFLNVDLLVPERMSMEALLQRKVQEKALDYRVGVPPAEVRRRARLELHRINFRVGPVEHVAATKAPGPAKCGCGADSCGGSLHSSYCPKYIPNP